MIIEIRHREDGTIPGVYDLVVNGRTEIRDETYAVVSGVADALRGRGDPTSELAEVADVIRLAHEEGA